MGIVANAFMIREVDLADTVNFLGSSNMHQIAERHGLWDPSSGEPLDFTAAFSDGEYLHQYYSGRRVWGALNLLTSQRFPAEYGEWRADKPYPAFVKPDQPVSVQSFAAVMGFHYEGTKFDQTRGVAAGPWGSPHRAMAGAPRTESGSWERTIGLARTSDSHIAQLSRSAAVPELLGVLWWGPHAAPTTLRVPVPAGLRVLPEALTTGLYEHQRKDTLFWACRWMFNVAQLKWSRMVGHVHDLQRHTFVAGARALAMSEAAMRPLPANSSARAAALEHIIRAHVEQAVDAAWALVDDLMWRYADGFVAGFDVAGQYKAVADIYPQWWIDHTDFSEGPTPLGR